MSSIPVHNLEECDDCFLPSEKQPEMEELTITTTTKKSNHKEKKKGRQLKYKKAPDAPRRFRSSFIFFSQSKHGEIRKQKEQDKKDGNNKTSTTTTVREQIHRASDYLYNLI